MSYPDLDDGRMRAGVVQNCERALFAALGDVEYGGEWVGQKKELTDYVMEIIDPTGVGEHHDEIVETLNGFHDPSGDGTPHYEVTTNWTFPQEEPRTNLTGEPTPSGETGKYFERLCQSEKGNQLEDLAYTIEQWGRNNRSVAQVFNVNDHLKAQFPPCLLDIQALYRDEKVNLSAHFRSHTLAKSYYGDIRALGRLQAWLADRVGAGVGSMVVHSGSIHFRKKNDEYELAEELLEVFED